MRLNLLAKGLFCFLKFLGAWSVVLGYTVYVVVLIVDVVDISYIVDIVG